MGMRKSKAFKFAQLVRSISVSEQGELNTLKVGDAVIGSDGSVINLPEDSTIGGDTVASVNVYNDSTYLPLVGNKVGDFAFALDDSSLFAWTGSVWASSKLSDAGGLTAGTLHIDRIADNAITAVKLDSSINDEIAANTSKLNTIEADANNYTLPSTLPASMLTGDLPAISGANLTNLPSSGGSSGGANLAFGDFSIDHSTGHLNLTWYGEASAGQVFSINNQGKLEVIV